MAGNFSTRAREFFFATVAARSSTAQLVAMMIWPDSLDSLVRKTVLYQPSIVFLTTALRASASFLIGSSMMPISTDLPVSGPPTPVQT